LKGGYELEKLEQVGFIFLEQHPSNPDFLKISFPLILVSILAVENTVSLDILKGISFETSPSDIERMDLDFVLYKLKFLSQIYPERFYLHWLFPTAKINVMLLYPEQFTAKTPEHRFDSTNFDALMVKIIFF